jgi:hypothetical protein
MLVWNIAAEANAVKCSHPTARTKNARRRLELERQRQEGEARRRDLHAQADRWAISRRLRRYLAAVERAVTERGDRGGPSAEQQRWLAWARPHADELDPLNADVRVANPTRRRSARDR